MLFTDGADAGAGGTSDSDAGAKSGDGEKGDDKAALARMAEQRDAAREAQRAADKQLKELSEKLEALEGKDKSDVERLTGERDKLTKELEAREMRLRDLAVTTALTTAATKAGARYPDLIVQRVAKDAELDDDLAVKNADALIATAKKDYPDLFRVVDGKADGGKRDERSGDDKLFGVTRLAQAHREHSPTR